MEMIPEQRLQELESAWQVAGKMGVVPIRGVDLKHLTDSIREQALPKHIDLAQVIKALDKLESIEGFNNLRMGIEPKYDFDVEHYREFKAWLVKAG